MKVEYKGVKMEGSSVECYMLLSSLIQIGFKEDD